MASTAPAMTTASLQFDPTALASELRTDNAEFRQALDAVALERRKAETTLEVRNARLADAKLIDAACRRIYEGFFLLADRADLLDRLRRALRRSTRRTASVTGDASPESDGQPDGEPDTDPPQDDEPDEAASPED